MQDLDEIVASAIDPFVAAHAVPQLGVGAVRGEQTLIRYVPPLDPEAAHPLFEIGSITKPFTGIALAALAARGTVRLDDPVRLHLPGGVGPSGANGTEVTLEHLATHTSGLPRLPHNLEDAVTDEDNPYADYTERHLMAAVIDGELQSPPGQGAEYSNFGFGLLGFALARAAACSFPELIGREVCEPLSLHETFACGVPDSHLARRLDGHDADGAPAKHWDNPTLAGAGCIESTIPDMVAFLRANIEPPRPLAGPIATTHQVRYGEPAGQRGAMIGNGLGWSVLRVADGWTFTWHNGGTGGFGSFCAFDPIAGTAVILMTNVTHSPDLDRSGAGLLRGLTN